MKARNGNEWNVHWLQGQSDVMRNLWARLIWGSDFPNFQWQSNLKSSPVNGLIHRGFDEGFPVNCSIHLSWADQSL